MTCQKHAKNPARGYSPCAGCEIEWMQTEIESLRADRDERARQKSELLAEIERLLDTIKAMTREREAARAWLRGELSGSRLGDPAPDRIACMWCGEICYGGREIAKQHVQECSKNPLVQRIRELERRSRNDCPER